MATESYWQRGFNDGYAGNPPQYPNKGGALDRQNAGYSNGYDCGHSKLFSERQRAWFERVRAAQLFVHSESQNSQRAGGGSE
jgi:hypothetical protein